MAMLPFLPKRNLASFPDHVAWIPGAAPCTHFPNSPTIIGHSLYPVHCHFVIFVQFEYFVYLAIHVPNEHQNVYASLCVKHKW